MPNLNGLWEYRKPGDKHWKAMSIPNNWETGGLKNYKGKVLFRKLFIINGLCLGKDYWLKFNGIDYKSRIWLNKKLLGTHTGYFQPFEFRITGLLKTGINTLLVEVDSSPERKTDWPENKKHIKGVFGHHDIRPGGWHPEYGQDHSTGGIWNSVELYASDKTKINKLWITSKLYDNYKLAKIHIKAELQTKNPIRGRSSRQVGTASNETGKTRTLRKVLTIRNPKLWWTWDQGTLYLYNRTIEIGGIKQKITFGIREIKFDKNQNLYLNGRKIFIRGSNIIPEEYLSQYTIQRVKKDLQLVKNANLNALRIHAHVNRKEFYEECDRAGILIWQDFPLQWEYTNTRLFTKEALRQCEDMVNHLYNHPSIFFFCCHNEPIKSRKTLDPLLYKAVSKIDKTRAIIMNSDFKEHPYPGWFTGTMDCFGALPGKPLVTEFGAQALPNLSTLKKMFAKKDIWPPNWQKWSYHNFVYEPTFNIAKVDKGRNINEFIRNSQEYQSKLIKLAISLYRSQKFTQITGLFHFLFADPWPCISYSVLDYFRKPKSGYWALKEVCQPLLLIYLPERYVFTIGDSLRGMFYLVNDYPNGFKNVNLKIKLGNFQYPVRKINIQPNSCIVANKLAYPLPIPKNFKAGEYKLIIKLSRPGGKVISTSSHTVKLGQIPEGLLEYNAVFDWDKY